MKINKTISTELQKIHSVELNYEKLTKIVENTNKLFLTCSDLFIELEKLITKSNFYKFK